MRPTRWITAFALATLTAAGALAQGGPGFGFGAFGSPAFLLRRAEVQADLKLSDEQKKSLMEAQQKQMAANQGLREKLQNASQEERQKILADLTAEQTKTINAILNPDQQKRLRQISLQQQGPGALATDMQAAAELKLTDEQKAKIRDLQMQQGQAVRALFQGGANAETFEKITALRKETGDKIAAVLTDEQKTRWKEMLGTELKLPPMRFGGN